MKASSINEDAFILKLRLGPPAPPFGAMGRQRFGLFFSLLPNCSGFGMKEGMREKNFVCIPSSIIPTFST